MLSLDLARRLSAAGLSWQPASGDRFVIPDRDMDDDVFVVSELTIEVHEFPSGRILGFNGTTEWALDSISQERALWLPREDQLRMALGDRFRALERSGSGWHVTVDMGDQVRRIVAEDAEDAYAYAVLELLARGLAPASRPVPSPRPKESRLG